MTIDQLRQFLSVSKYRNFSKGAEALFLHQSTVSKSIALLEEDVGGALFVRKRKDLQLTDAGRFLNSEAPLLIDRFDSLLRHTQSIAVGRSGNLRMLATAAHTGLIAPVYRQFRLRYPHIFLGIQEDRAPSVAPVWEKVLEGSADFAITPTGELPEGLDELERRFLARDDFVLLVSATHPLARRESVSLRELSGETVLILRTMQLAPLQMISGRLFAVGLTPLNIVTVDREREPQPFSYLALQVSAGLGVTLVPRRLAVAGGWGGALLPLSDFELPFDLSLIWRSNNANPAMELFVQVLDEALRERGPGPVDAAPLL